MNPKTKTEILATLAIVGYLVNAAVGYFGEGKTPDFAALVPMVLAAVAAFHAEPSKPAEPKA